MRRSQFSGGGGHRNKSLNPTEKAKGRGSRKDLPLLRGAIQAMSCRKRVSLASWMFLFEVGRASPKLPEALSRGQAAQWAAPLGLSLAVPLVGHGPLCTQFLVWKKAVITACSVDVGARAQALQPACPGPSHTCMHTRSHTRTHTLICRHTCALTSPGLSFLGCQARWPWNLRGGGIWHMGSTQCMGSTW